MPIEETALENQPASGGDEFAVILQNADEATVKEAIKRVLAFQSEINREPSGHSLSISLGSATA